MWKSPSYAEVVIALEKAQYSADRLREERREWEDRYWRTARELDDLRSAGGANHVVYKGGKYHEFVDYADARKFAVECAEKNIGSSYTILSARTVICSEVPIKEKYLKGDEE